MQGSLRGHATRLVLSLIAVAGAISLAGCNGSNIPIPRETITFTYKFAEQRQPDVYHLQVLRGAIGDPPPCGLQVEDRMRLEQIAFSAQRLAYPSLVNACTERFSVDVANARAADPHFAEFEFHRLQGTSDRRAHMIANNALTGDSYPTPSKIQIELNSAVLEGVKTTDGFAEISFGASGPIYRCEGSPGEDFWEEHIGNPESDTFFEFTLTSYDPATRGLGAKFQCLARNASDPNDNRLLLVMQGSVFMTAEN